MELLGCHCRLGSCPCCELIDKQSHWFFFALVQEVHILKGEFACFTQEVRGTDTGRCFEIVFCRAVVFCLPARVVTIDLLPQVPIASPVLFELVELSGTHDCEGFNN